MLERIMAMMEQNKTATSLQIEALTQNARQDAQNFQHAMAESAAQIASFRAEIEELKRGSNTPAHSSHPLVAPAIPGETERSSPVRHTSTSFVPSVYMPVAPEKVRVPTLPVLGKGTGELPYLTWSKTTRALLDAASACYVLDNLAPATDENGALQWYTMTSKKVFAAILQAVGKVPIIGTKILNLAGDLSSAKRAWEELKKFFIREADSNLPFLQKSLRELTPERAESMESFISRCNELVRLYESYGLTLSDQDLLVQIFSVLSNAWRKSLGIKGPITSMPWDEISLALQEEDNDRAQSNTSAEDALLPLGWTRGQQRVNPIGLPTQAAANVGTGEPWGRGKRGNSPLRRRVPNIVCYACFKRGHGALECRSKPPGWQITPEAKAKAHALKDSYITPSSPAPHVSTPGEAPPKIPNA
jgi:hypothetical protein